MKTTIIDGIFTATDEGVTFEPKATGASSMNFSDIVKLIMKDTGKGYAESAQMLDKAIQPTINQILNGQATQ